MVRLDSFIFRIIETSLSFVKAVTLFPLDRMLDLTGEEQKELQWIQKRITDTDDNVNYFLYAELKSVELKKLDRQNSRPCYSAKMCQIQFQFKIRVNH